MSRLPISRISGLFAVAVATSALTGLAFAAETKATTDESKQIPVSLAVDQAQMLRLDTPAATVVVGNPAIADAALKDSSTVFLIGRNFGVTNLIFLDADGKQVANLKATVGRGTSSTVTLNRGAGQYTYACAPNCDRVLFVTDADFKDLSQNAGQKIDNSVSAAEKGSAGQD